MVKPMAETSTAELKPAQGQGSPAAGETLVPPGSSALSLAASFSNMGPTPP